LGFVSKIFPSLGKLVKQHVLHSSNIEKRIVDESELDALVGPRSLVHAVRQIDEAASLCGVNTGAISRVAKVFSAHIQTVLTKHGEEIVNTTVSNLKTAENAANLLDTFLSKFHHLLEDTWVLAILLFSSKGSSGSKHDTTRGFLFQKLPNTELPILEKLFYDVASVFDAQFGEFYKQASKKKHANTASQLKNAMEMLYSMYKFYGDPTAISYLPLRIFYEEVSKGKHSKSSTAWVVDYLSSQYPLIELTKLILKIVDVSPPSNISTYFTSYIWSMDDSGTIVDRLQLFLKCSAILVIIANDPPFAFKPSPTEIVYDFIASASSFGGEVSSNTSKGVARGMQKFTTQNQSLLTLANQEISSLTTVNNFIDYETLNIYKQLMPDVLSTLPIASGNSSRAKTQFQDLI